MASARQEAWDLGQQPVDDSPPFPPSRPCSRDGGAEGDLAIGGRDVGWIEQEQVHASLQPISQARHKVCLHQVCTLNLLEGIGVIKELGLRQITRCRCIMWAGGGLFGARALSIGPASSKHTPTHVHSHNLVSLQGPCCSFQSGSTAVSGHYMGWVHTQGVQESHGRADDIPAPTPYFQASTRSRMHLEEVQR